MLSRAFLWSICLLFRSESAQIVWCPAFDMRPVIGRAFMISLARAILEDSRLSALPNPASSL